MQAFACAWAGRPRGSGGSSPAPPSRCAPGGSRGTAVAGVPVQPRAAVAFASWQLVQARTSPPRARAAGGEPRRPSPSARRARSPARGCPARCGSGGSRAAPVAGRARRRGTRGRRSSASPPCRGRARRGRGGSRRSAPRSARSRACSRRGSARTRSCAPRSGSGARARRPPAASGGRASGTPRRSRSGRRRAPRALPRRNAPSIATPSSGRAWWQRWHATVLCVPRIQSANSGLDWWQVAQRRGSSST